MKFSFFTTIGKVRTENEDNCALFKNNDQEFIAVICDGMGGHNGGKIASSFVVDYLIDEFKITFNFTIFNQQDVQKWFQNIISNVIKELEFLVKKDSTISFMGTTMVCVLGVGGQVYIANIGDSRAYLFHKNKLEQITIDHNVSTQMVQEGIISKHDAVDNPYRNVLFNCIGPGRKPKIDLFSFPFKKCKLLLTSDGIHQQLSKEEIKKIIKKNYLEPAVKLLCETANRKGGIDNATALIIKIN